MQILHEKNLTAGTKVNIYQIYAFEWSWIWMNNTEYASFVAQILGFRVERPVHLGIPEGYK